MIEVFVAIVVIGVFFVYIRKIIKKLKKAELYFRSYSQEGEDMILNRILKGNNGFYVDVGAHHPRKFSNTCHFYEKGWRGINIDAVPGSMEPFKKYRPRDINIEVGIAAEAGEQKFHVFEEKALCTFDEKQAKKYCDDGADISDVIAIKTKPLSQILEENLPEGQNIDFLDVDVEGLDLEVLKSNEWQRFSPTCVVVESHGSLTEDFSKTEVYRFLTSQGYEWVSKTVISLIFVKKEYLSKC